MGSRSICSGVISGQRGEIAPRGYVVLSERHCLGSLSSNGKKNRRIAPLIVMATYQGSRYIREQIESIQAQTYGDWRLLIRDDGSEDGTRELIRSAARSDLRINLIDDSRGRVGVKRNFSLLLERALVEGAEWIALCDQDDHWHPQKLERQLEIVAEFDLEPDLPVLLHADAAVVDARLGPLYPSLHRLMGLRHEATTPLATLLVQNFVTGCSCLVNRSLLQIALPVPEECVMYDWWLALCVSATGKLLFQPDSMLLYRQHAHNEVGAQSRRLMLRDLFMRTMSWSRHDPDEFMDTLRQAVALQRRLIDRSSDASADDFLRRRLDASISFVSRYLDLYRPGQSRFMRVLAMHRGRIRRQDPILDAALKLKMLTSSIRLQPGSLARSSTETPCDFLE